ncbi:MAG: DUF456 family protein [Caldilineaceae bacterium]|nr:DUF456 family protein [Caldilineaceae bacterium]HRJ41190.1 DUF456 domain-containing protein [Caldilineaceae bacterium]
MTDYTPIFSALGYLLIFLGLVGAVVPLLPGPAFIWLGVFLWAWGDGFVRIGWPTLLFLGVLTLIAWGVDITFSLISSRKAGAGWKSIGVSILTGIGGGILLSFIPLIGSILGAIGGAIGGLWYMEYRAKGDKELATQAVRGYIGGVLVSMAVEMGAAVLMILVFAWQAFV